jgi:hypothetical protein
MQDSFVAETAQACMAMNNFNLLSNNNVPKIWEEREDGWEGRGAIYDKEGDVVDFETIGEIPNASSAIICMRDDDNLVSAVDQLR